MKNKAYNLRNFSTFAAILKILNPQCIAVVVRTPPGQRQTFQLPAGFRVPRPFAIHPVSSRRVRLLVEVSRVDLLCRRFIFSLDFQKSPHDFVSRGRPLCGQKRLAPLAKRSTCSKSIFLCLFIYVFFSRFLSEREGPDTQKFSFH